jgi:hypothetical protein
VTRWLERYRAGDHIQVWTELTGLGTDLRDTAVWPDAVAVARETMRRARENVRRLSVVLPARGYRFADPDAVLVPPPADVAAQLDALEAAAGPLPLSLRCWYEEVGQVDLTGEHPDWSHQFPDPLVVSAPVETLLLEHETWSADRGTEWDRGAFAIELAPDALHKSDVSGGPPYSMVVPDASVDALFRWENHQTTFVNYLRICFRFGGFPGWDVAYLDDAQRPPTPRPTVLREVAADLLPL